MATEKRLIDVNKPIMETESIINFRMCHHMPIEDYESFLNYLKKQPIVDAVEVVHGRWESELMPTGVEYTGCAEMTVQALSCSVCGKCVDVSEGYFLYCPHCGAKMMDGDGNG